MNQRYFANARYYIFR